MRISIAWLLLVVFPVIAWSETLHVPDDYGTIQEAIIAAENGDVVLVKPGSYVEHLNFLGKRIIVRSDKDALVETKDLAPETTIIDGGQVTSVVAFFMNETDRSVLKGFTLKNGIGFDIGGGDRRGGGVFCFGSTPIIANNIIKGNTANYGGGIACHNSSANAYITENYITHNNADSRGGGIHCFESSPYITHNTISTNTGGIEGGGIHIAEFGAPAVFNNIIKKNTANAGGAISCKTGMADISNNIFKHNIANFGGAIYLYSSVPNVTNCTFFKNNAYVAGGSFECNWYSFPNITNCILWDNTTGLEKEIIVDATSVPDVSFCDVEGGYPGDGNIDLDPEFLCTASIPEENLHLAPTSPCIDAGSNLAPAIGPSDFNHEPRINGQFIDMGVDEFYDYPAHELHVPSQYLTIQAAIDAAAPGSIVYVAPKFHNEGPYNECIHFRGKAITVVSDWDANPLTYDTDPTNTIIDGMQMGSVASFVAGEGPDSVLDGFTLSNGSGTFCYNYYFGGGVYCDGSSPTICNNFIRENECDYGGGIHCTTSSPHIIGNRVEENVANMEGGGIHLYASSDAMIDSNMICHNSGGGSGGGVKLYGFSEPSILNNIFYDNEADLGGGLGCNRSAPILRNNTFHANNADSYGGAVYASEDSLVEIQNSILWENASSPGTEIYVELNSTLTIDNSNITEGRLSIHLSPGCTLNYGTYGNPFEVGIIELDPRFVDVVSENFSLALDSPCINRGCKKKATEKDIKGVSRPFAGEADMGAYEYTGFQPFTADSYSFSAANGGSCTFTLDAGIENASRQFHVLGCVYGTAPGVHLSSTALLPLNIFILFGMIQDPLFSMIISTYYPMFPDFIYQTLDQYGKGSATMTIDANMVPPSSVGMTWHFSSCLYGPYDYASNAVGVEILP